MHTLAKWAAEFEEHIKTVSPTIANAEAGTTEGNIKLLLLAAWMDSRSSLRIKLPRAMRFNTGPSGELKTPVVYLAGELESFLVSQAIQFITPEDQEPTVAAPSTSPTL